MKYFLFLSVELVDQTQGHLVGHYYYHYYYYCFMIIIIVENNSFLSEWENTVKMVVRMIFFFFFLTKVCITLLLHSALECMQPNLGRSLLPNGDIFCLWSSVYLFSVLLSLCFLAGNVVRKKEAKIANSMESTI